MNTSAAAHLARIRASTRTMPPERMRAILNKYGFTQELELPRSWVFAHPDRSGPPLTVPKVGPLEPALVKRLADAIEEVLSDAS